MGEAARAIIENGVVKPLEPLTISEGTEVLIVPVDYSDDDWWIGVSPSIQAMWDNPDDDIYDQLYKE